MSKLRAKQLAARLGDLRNEEGVSVLELALVLPLLLLLLVGAVDIGRAFFAAIEVSSAANAGAEYGAQNPTDTAGMRKAALQDGADLTGLTASANWGCECSDGSSAVAACTSTPSCAVNAVKYVTVSTSLTYTPVLQFPGVPASFPLRGNARLRSGN